MRDVTGSDPSNSESPLKEISQVLIRFIKNPVQQIGRLPDWSWGRLITLNAGIAVISGVISGFIPPNFYKIAGGLIISPLTSTLMNGLMALFLYYYFQLFEYKTIGLRKLFTQTFFASIPFFIFQMGSELIPPISVVGFAFTAIIMVVGLVENFQMEKTRAMKLMGLVLGVVFLVWLWNRIDIARM